MRSCRCTRRNACDDVSSMTTTPIAFWCIWAAASVSSAVSGMCGRAVMMSRARRLSFGFSRARRMSPSVMRPAVLERAHFLPDQGGAHASACDDTNHFVMIASGGTIGVWEHRTRCPVIAKTHRPSWFLTPDYAHMTHAKFLPREPFGVNECPGQGVAKS